MPLLLDTCIVYDWLMGAITDQATINLIRSHGAYVSAVTVWEMVIKQNIGKLELPTTRVADEIEAQGFQWLNVTAAHAQAVHDIGNYHKDPFDRLLIAQAKHESMQLATYDDVFRRYASDTLIVAR